MKEIKLKVNDKEIHLNEIMSNVITNMLNGFLDALKDIPEEREKISLKILL